MISEFREEYSFLSNFSRGKVVHDGIEYDYRENAFQAAKVFDNEKRLSLQHVKPSVAKSFGKVCKLRPDWEEVKDRIMYQIVYDCFNRNQDLKDALLETGDQEIVEGNAWGDTYWGVCKGVGKNKLGQILMRVRTELAGKIELRYVDEYIDMLNKKPYGKFLMKRLSKLDDKYICKGESIEVSDRDGNPFTIGYDTVDAMLHDLDNFVGCTASHPDGCAQCLTPIC